MYPLRRPQEAGTTSVVSLCCALAHQYSQEKLVHVSGTLVFVFAAQGMAWFWWLEELVFMNSTG